MINCGYHFIIKELLEECERQFICLGENTKKYITFPVPMKKVSKSDKKENKSLKSVYYWLQFSDSAIYMASSLSNVANNLA